MQLSQADTTDVGTTTSFDTSGGITTTTYDSSGGSSTTYYTPPAAATPASTTAMDSVSQQAVQSATDPLGNLNLSSLVNSIAAGYVSVQKAINAGQYAGLPYPAPGTVQQLPGGATRVVNSDGSTTITDAQGNKTTIYPNGQVQAGGPSLLSSLGGNSTLLLAGGAILLLMMLKRRA